MDDLSTGYVLYAVHPIALDVKSRKVGWHSNPRDRDRNRIMYCRGPGIGTCSIEQVHRSASDRELDQESSSSRDLSRIRSDKNPNFGLDSSRYPASLR